MVQELYSFKQVRRIVLQAVQLSDVIFGSRFFRSVYVSEVSCVNDNLATVIEVDTGFPIRKYVAKTIFCRVIGPFLYEYCRQLYFLFVIY